MKTADPTTVGEAAAKRANDRPRHSRRVVVLGTALSGPLAACQVGSQAASPASEAQPKAVKDTGPISVYQWDTPTSPFGQWLLSYFEAFPQKTGIKLEILQSSGQGPLDAQQASWFAAGDAPDVFPRTARGNLQYAPLALRGTIRPLTDYIKRDKFDTSDFWPRVLQLMTAKDKLWIMPQDFNQGLFAYLVPPFEQAAVPLPPTDWKATNWTWAEFTKREQQVQSRLAGSGGQTQWAFGRPPVNIFLWSNGADYLSADGKNVTIAEPPAIEALDFAAKLMHTYGIAPRPQDPLPQGDPLANQAVVMNTLFAASVNNQIRAKDPNLAFDITLVPRGPGGKEYISSGGGGGYTLYGQSKHPDAAWELLKYIGDKEYGKHKAEFGALGPRKSTATFFIDPSKPPKHAQVYLEAPAHARWTPNLTNWSDINKAVDEALAPLLRGEQAAKDAATNAKQAIQALLPQGELFQ